MEELDKFDLEYYLANQEGEMFHYHDGTHDVCLFEFDDIYVKQVEPDYPNMVCSQTQYFSDTLSVKSKGEYLKHGGVGIGVWEYYNENGTLNHTENKDEHFPITWPQMEQILKDRDISLLAIDSISRDYDSETDTATWSFIINIPMDKGILYVFDAKTGEKLSEEVIDMSKER